MSSKTTLVTFVLRIQNRLGKTLVWSFKVIRSGSFSRSNYIPIRSFRKDTGVGIRKSCSVYTAKY